jgi:hypothetical protein
LRWTCKSVRRLAQALQAQGHQVSRTLVAELLNAAGYSLQANRKTKEGDTSRISKSIVRPSRDRPAQERVSLTTTILDVIRHSRAGLARPIETGSSRKRASDRDLARLLTIITESRTE